MKTSDNNISRKDFIRNSALAVKGLTLIPNIMTASPFDEKNLSVKGKMSLKNVRLETGFDYRDGEVSSTKTDLFYIEVENGKIIKISPNQPSAKAVDAKGLLMLPAFKDMHIHLDKTFYGDQWQAVRKRTGGIKGMIELEQKMLPEMLKNSTFKAEKLIELLQSKGNFLCKKSREY